MAIFRANKDRRKVYYIRKTSGVPTVLNTRIINPDSETVKYRDSLFPIDIGNPAFKIKNTFVYVVDITTGQLNLGNSEKVKSPSLLRQLIMRNLAKQLVTGLEGKPAMEIIIIIILALIVGVCLGYFVGNIAPMS